MVRTPLFSKILLFLLVIHSSAENTGFNVTMLPYSSKSLDPYMTRRTLKSLHTQHYQKHIKTVNAMIRTIDALEESSLEDVMRYSQRWNRPLFSNAAQAWNLAFFFKCMTSNFRPPSPKLESIIVEHFGSFDNFKKDFAAAGRSVFGSGWAWLVYDSENDSLLIRTTSGADNPLVESDAYSLVLTIDVWEHAYYLDYENRRIEYIDSYLDNLVDWMFVAENIERAKSLAIEDPEATQDQQSN